MSAAGHSLVSGARRIAVLRPNALGDYIFALPALHALRHHYPGADITLLGLSWHAQFLRGRPGPVDRIIVLPPLPGMGAPPDAAIDATPTLQALRALRFDLALQMYGGGGYSNAFVAALGAGVTAGAAAPGAVPLDRTIRYSEHANRRLELLQIAALVGAQPRLISPELDATAADRAQATGLLPHQQGERIVVVHPGASDPRRRWPPSSFAMVADALAASGARIVISATADEAALVRELRGHMRQPSVDLGGRLPLPALCALLKRACMTLSNDTGPLHLSLALGTPAAGIFWLTNMIESCPLAQHLLRPAIATRTQCPVCGQENLRTRCRHDVSFVGDVGGDEMAAIALDLFNSVR